MASVLDLVKHYQHAIEKYANDEQKILKCIDKLFNLKVTVQHLQDTGVGRTVNALRKEPGEVGQASRALVSKWKLMVAAEESDQETDHNDTMNHNGYGNGKDSDDNSRQHTYHKEEKLERRSTSSKHNERKSHGEMNGNYSGNKRRHHSSEEEEPDVKKSKSLDRNNRDDYKKSIVKVKSEPRTETESEEDESDRSHSDDSESDISDSTVEEDKIKEEVKVKKETTEYHKTSKHSSRHEDYKKEKSSHESKSTNSTSSKHSSSGSKDRHSSEKSSKENLHSSHKSTKEKENSSEKKHKSDHKEKERDKDKKHKEELKTSKNSSNEKHKSSSQSDSGTDKHKNEKHSSKSEKHKGSSNSHKSDKDRHKSSSEKEISHDKHKSKDRSSSKDKHSSSSKEKAKEKSSSTKDKNDRSEKLKHSSSSEKSKSDAKSHDNVDDKSRDRSKHKSSSSSHKSSKSNSNKSTEDIPKKKTQVSPNEDSDDGIGCESGASFAEALGMISPAKPKKKLALKDSISPGNADLSPAALLAPTAKLAPLPALEISALPEISPNYKPRPPPKLMPHFTDEEAMSAVISSKNQRTKVYSGNKVIGKIPTLYEMCVHILQEHIDALEYTGGVPYEILKPVIDKATPNQLFLLEHYNPYLMEDTDHLWQKFCEKNFRRQQRQEMETWREMYIRCQEEQEVRLRSLTENIKIAQEAKKAPIKQTKMAYVDSVVKPPRNIARKQALHGTAHAAAASPAARVASLAAAPNILRGSARPTPVPASASSSFKPKKAPLMAKALQFMRGRKR